MKVFSKIKDDPAFKTDPDKVIRKFLPASSQKYYGRNDRWAYSS